MNAIDEEQGVCPRGHDCYLLAREGGWSRSCRECDYIGAPLLIQSICASCDHADEAHGDLGCDDCACDKYTEEAS